MKPAVRISFGVVVLVTARNEAARMRRQLEREDERLADVLAFTGRLE